MERSKLTSRISANLAKIRHSKNNTGRFLIHAQETKKMRHQELLLNLLACNGE